MADEKGLLGMMRDKAEELSGTAREIANLNQKEAGNFENSEILDEIEEDEEAIEHFDRNVEKLEDELDEAIHQMPEFDPESKKQLWNNIVTISEESLQLVERYSHLPERFTEAAVLHEDEETANAALTYFIKIEHILELTEEICDAEAEETVTDEFRDVKRPTEKLRGEKKKLQKERKKIEKERRMAKSKLQGKGLV